MPAVSNMPTELIIQTVKWENKFEVPATSVDHEYNNDITLNNIADHRPRPVVNSLHDNRECSNDDVIGEKIESAVNNNANNNACTSLTQSIGFHSIATQLYSESKRNPTAAATNVTLTSIQSQNVRKTLINN